MSDVVGFEADGLHELRGCIVDLLHEGLDAGADHLAIVVRRSRHHLGHAGAEFDGVESEMFRVVEDAQCLLRRIAHSVLTL